MSRFHAVRDPLDAIHQALRPGVSGTSPRYGGTEFNAGAGLFFIKSIAKISRNFFVTYSGDAMFKLLKGPAEDQPQIVADPVADRATREGALPAWPGTVVGIDVNVSTHETFRQLLRDIGSAYDLDVRLRKKSSYRKARFE